MAPNDERYFNDGAGHLCKTDNRNECYERRREDSNLSGIFESATWEQLSGLTLEGYCKGTSGPTLRGHVIDPTRATFLLENCRYFVATDKIRPKTLDDDFSNHSIWILDDNRYTGLGDLWHFYSDTLFVAQNVQSDAKNPRRSIPIRSNYFELLPGGHTDPVFSLYSFYRWTTYLNADFKAVKLNALDWNYLPTHEVANFRGTQELASRTAIGESYSMGFRVLRLCTTDNESLTRKKSSSRREP